MSSDQSRFGATNGDEDKHFAVDWSKSPIDRLHPGSEHHDFVLEYLLRRIRGSSDTMQRFYSRWNVAERKTQAYMDVRGYEKLIHDMNDASRQPAPAVITIPYMFATISTIVTYMGRVFCSQNPIFQPKATNGTTVDKAEMMAAIMDYNNSHDKLIAKLYQWFLDGETYGVAALRNTWDEKWGRRTMWRPASAMELLLKPNDKEVRDYEDKIVFEGNCVENLDPFTLFPDPNVPMAQCNEKGEFIFWRDFTGRHKLLTAERMGQVKYVKDIMPQDCRVDQRWFDLSNRGLKAQGMSRAGNDTRMTTTIRNFYQVDQGSIEIIPADLGLGNSYYPEKWFFTIIGGRQIIQAVPLDLDHGKHPVAIAEPYSNGYGFGQAGISDYLGQIQDMISWMLNAHMQNVRTAMNNMFVVDPSRIEIADMKRPEPGKIIRLKRNAVGTDVRTAVQQLQVQDVTRQFIQDLPSFIKVGDSISAVNDMMRGTGDAKSHTTATQIRSEGESNLGRLSSHAAMYSSQGFTDLGQQQCMNIQQLMSRGVMVEIAGGTAMTVTPQMLSGEYNFPVHDGTLPLDKAGMMQTFTNMIGMILKDQQLRTQFNLVDMVCHAAQMGGMLNVQQFKMGVPGAPPGAIQPPLNQLPPNIAPTEQVIQQADAGNMVPVGRQ